MSGRPRAVEDFAAIRKRLEELRDTAAPATPEPPAHMTRCPCGFPSPCDLSCRR